MIQVNLLLRVLAFVCFLLAALGISSRVNLQALGLTFWVASTFII